MYIKGIIQKNQDDKVYLGQGDEPPKGVRVEVGPKQGRFYRPQDKQAVVKGSISLLGKQFKDAGFSLYEVGGSVRDSLLGRESSDLDFTTDATPDKTKQLLEKSGLGSVFSVGEKYGTIGLHTKDGEKIEITTYRADVYPTTSRKPEVTFGKNLKEDLARRDFTINAMAKDVISGELIDPFNGKDDLEKGIIRAVGDAKARYAEDPLRMMRAVRFACRLGFKLETEMPEPEKLKNISKERIQEELSKILVSKDPKRGVSLLRQFGLMKYVIPEFEKTYDVKQNKAHYADVYNHTLGVIDNASKLDYEGKDKEVLMLVAMLHDIGKPDTKTGEGEFIHFYHHDDKSAEISRNVLHDLHYDNDTIERVVKLVNAHMQPHLAEPNSRVVNRMVRNLGEQDTKMLIDLAEADAAASSKLEPMRFKQYRETLANESIPKTKITSPISGKEIMDKFEIPAGKPIGEVKEFLTNKVMDGELAIDDKDAAYSMAEQYIKEKGLKKSFDKIWVLGIINKALPPGFRYAKPGEKPDMIGPGGGRLKKLRGRKPAGAQELAEGVKEHFGKRGWHEVGMEEALKPEAEARVEEKKKEIQAKFDEAGLGKLGEEDLNRYMGMDLPRIERHIGRRQQNLKNEKLKVEIKNRFKQEGIDFDDDWQLNGLAEMGTKDRERHIKRIVERKRKEERRKAEKLRRQAEDEKLKIKGREMALPIDRIVPPDEEEDVEMVDVMKYAKAASDFKPFSGKGVNGSGTFKGYFDKNNPQKATALCKRSCNASPVESVENEVASYELFKILGKNWKKYCPETVTRYVEEDSHEGDSIGKCSAQKWIHGSQDMHNGNNYHTDDLKALLAFDIIAWNHDRHGGNSVWLIDENNPDRPKVYAVDNGYTFDRNFRTSGHGWFNNTPENRLTERGETELHPAMKADIENNIINNQGTLYKKLGSYLPENTINDIIERAKILVKSGDLYVAKEIIYNMDWEKRDEEEEDKKIEQYLKKWKSRRQANQQIWRGEQEKRRVREEEKALKQQPYSRSEIKRILRDKYGIVLNVSEDDWAMDWFEEMQGLGREGQEHEIKLLAERMGKPKPEQIGEKPEVNQPEPEPAPRVFQPRPRIKREKMAPRKFTVPEEQLNTAQRELRILQGELDEANRESASW
jgi:poly(A) polymerase